MTEPRLRANRSSRHDVFGDLDQHPLTFSAYDHVDPREAIVQRGAHRAVAIVAAEHDRERRIPRLENLRQNERGHILLKHAGKADDAWRPGEDSSAAASRNSGTRLRMRAALIISRSEVSPRT